MATNFLTERQQVALAKTLSDPSSNRLIRPIWFSAHTDEGGKLSASRSHSGWDHQSSDASPIGMNFEEYSPASSASTEEKLVEWSNVGLPPSSDTVSQRMPSSGGRTNATKSTIKRRGRPRFSAKSATLDARKTQKTVKEAASTLLDISDRVPFTGVRSSGVKIWAKFDQETRSCVTVKELLRQGRWFLGQIKDHMKSEGWGVREKEWLEASKQCADPQTCKTLVSELESLAINWTAVARTWATEQGLDVSTWPTSWAAPGSGTVVPCTTQAPRVEKWRACCEARLGGKWRQLGLTFTLAVPADVAAAGPARHLDDAGATIEAEWEGAREDGDAGSRNGGELRRGSGSMGSESDSEMEEEWEEADSSCCHCDSSATHLDMQPRSPYHGSRASDGTLEPVGGEMVGDGMIDEPVGSAVMLMDGADAMYCSEPCVRPELENGTCPGVIDDDRDQLHEDPDQLVEGLWSCNWN